MTLTMIVVFLSKVVMVGCYYIAPLFIPFWMWQYLASKKRKEKAAAANQLVALDVNLTENLEKA
ncbi:hypothetical protein [Bacillus sp. 1P06AnD]|uniref:hypothetical protein n=1 Tax=Bacillus sp. 1P06AnD TaxID=3132208 RepID=UPI0039A00141